MVLVLAHALAPAQASRSSCAHPCSRIQEAAALALALCSLLLGLFPGKATSRSQPGSTSTLPTLKTLFTTLLLILAGGVMACLLGRWRYRPESPSFGASVVAIVGSVRRKTIVFGEVFERIDVTLRQWTAAGVLLLALAIMFGVAMLAGR